jgi:hypothetical protein
MLVMYDLLIPPVRRRFREHLDKLPYFAAAAAFGLLAMITQSDNHGGGRVAYPENALVVVPFSMLPVLVNYLRLAIWPDPSRLCVLYFPPLKTYLDGTVFLAICISILLVMVGWYCYRKDRTVLFWYTLFFIGLLPVSQIVPLITMMNDRYLYFPMLGVAGLVAHGSGRLWERVRTIPWRGYAMLAMCAGLVNALSVASSIRGRVWMDSITLFGDAVAKYPNEASALSRLAEGYVAAGDLNKARGLYESARLKGTLDDLAVYNLVQIYFEQKEFDAAYKLISEIQPGNEKIMRKSLLLGEYLYRIGNYPDAEENLLAHLAQEPDSAHGLYLLGQTYLMTGYTERAGELYYKAVAAGGDNAGLFFALACAESMQGHVGKSLAALESALRNGLSSKDLQEGEGCLKNIRNGPRYRQLFQQYLGANRP